MTTLYLNDVGLSLILIPILGFFAWMSDDAKQYWRVARANGVVKEDELRPGVPPYDVSENRFVATVMHLVVSVANLAVKVLLACDCVYFVVAIIVRILD